MRNRLAIPVIDLFAGPGGLGEGFSAAGFDIRLSIEKDPAAHRTLELRSFVHQFEIIPDDYYEHLRGRRSRSELFANHPREAAAATREAVLAELGVADPAAIDARIAAALDGADPWVLIGGPPCQAYSLVGRSRNRGIAGYSFETDRRATLYREYLRILAGFWPAAFVMENVRGLLSVKLAGKSMFDLICADLRDPAAALGRKPKHTYSLHALAPESLFPGSDPSDFLIRCERHGIPQARHRVIVVGLRNDVDTSKLGPLTTAPRATVQDAICDLPKLRSGLSKETDLASAWLEAIAEIGSHYEMVMFDRDIREELYEIGRASDRMVKLGRGGEFVSHDRPVKWMNEWFHDPRLKGAVNHSTRSHIRGDLHRYLFAAVFATVRGRSPKLSDFPRVLLPDHGNAEDDDPAFSDRFRVQLRRKPSTTVTSHISKDGHYYIHYDPRQCRSLTVREAARLQTFPDNYFFVGPRTDQYRQVGNAVPPLLAKQIAQIIANVLN
jgi:DNA (cytosine-5)-methyltransferase 1